jgi:hypothetical protein
MDNVQIMRKISQFFARFTNRDYIIAAIAFSVAVMVSLFIHIYNQRRVEDFSLRLNNAKTAQDFQAILSDNCPAVVKPLAEYFLAKNYLESGKNKEAFDMTRRFIETNKEHFLYGRALIGYIHSGFELTKTKDFLESCLAMVKERDFCWKNEALYDIALFYEEISLNDKALELYKTVFDSGDVTWKSSAEFKIAELKRKSD